MNRPHSLPSAPPPLPDAAPAEIARSQRLLQLIEAEIHRAGGWIPFDRYMEWALYAPALGYYAAAPGVLGSWGGSSDFVTAPELGPLFAATLARQLTAAGRAENLDCVVEFGAGSGRLACDLLRSFETAGWLPRQYAIVEVSAAMRARQQASAQALPAELRNRLVWWDALPERFDALVIGNEVLDAMPVKLAERSESGWLERGVALEKGCLAWRSRATGLQPRPSMEALPTGAVTELHPAAEAFIATLAERLGRGLALFVDYGFPAREFDHPQRDGGTLRCHRAHRAHDEPLWQPGLSDITAHVDFSGIARTALDHGLQLLGYTSQARFLLNSGLLDALQQQLAVIAASDAAASPDAPSNRAGLALAASVQKLVNESEMGELFKVIALGRGIQQPLLGFAAGDRCASLLD